ncbi:PAS domain-containing sensor histidine kinase [Candidatus Poribacteria bacterium]
MLTMSLFHRSKQKREVKRSAQDNMSTWVGALAHEIKNPLNAMKINLQLLQEDIGGSLKLASDDTDEVRVLKKVEILAGEVDRLEKILNDFLRLARLPEPDLQPGDISALLDELLDFIEPETRQSDIELIRDFDSDLPIVYFDSGQMKQALLNVILNANQSMSTGGQLTIKAYKTNGYISIDVVDTGEGIPLDRISRLFDLFYSTKKDGTGLGLSIACRIANIHGGEIRVESRENEGTTVSILLPISND